MKKNEKYILNKKNYQVYINRKTFGDNFFLEVIGNTIDEKG